MDLARLNILLKTVMWLISNLRDRKMKNHNGYTFMW
jgi:hypothetical protein